MMMNVFSLLSRLALGETIALVRSRGFHIDSRFDRVRAAAGTARVSMR